MSAQYFALPPKITNFAEICAHVRTYTRINIGLRRVRRNTTIGFDAKYANVGNNTQSSYARFVIEAIAEACPRHSYLRMYVPSREEHAEYDALASRHNVESMEPDGSLWRKMPWLWRLWPIGRDMQRGDVRLYHSLTSFLPYGLERRGIRTIVTVHNLEFLRLRGLFSPLHNMYRRAAMLSSLTRADRIVALSESIKHDLVRYLRIDSDKIDVIYRGCHHRFAEPITPETLAAVRDRYHLPARYMVVVGTHLPRKNLGHLVETLRRVDEDIAIVVVGRATTYTEHISRRIKSLGLGDRVTMLHGVADEDMPAIYHQAIAYLMPSLYEGFATSIVEAITVGTPVIAAKGSSLEEAGGPSSIYVDATDRDALAEAISRVANDEELQQRMIRDGKAYASRFRPEVIAYNLLNCYRRIGIELDE